MLSPLRDIVLHKNSNPNLFYISQSSLSQFGETFFQPKHFKVDFSRTASSLFLAKGKAIHFLILETPLKKYCQK